MAKPMWGDDRGVVAPPHVVRVTSAASGEVVRPGAALPGAKPKKELYNYSAFYGLEPVAYESEAGDRYMSEKRGQQLHQEVRKRESPESLQLGAKLRMSSICHSHRPLATGQSEARMRFVAHQSDVADHGKAGELKKAFQTSNIDHAYGRSKSCSHWVSAQSSDLNGNAAAKFACEKPRNTNGKELRKSSVPVFGVESEMSTGRAFPKATEHNKQFLENPRVDPDTAREAREHKLRAASSCLDLSNGRRKAPAHQWKDASWKGMNHVAMEDNVSAKWECKKPSNFAHLGKELRKANICMGYGGSPLDK